MFRAIPGVLQPVGQPFFRLATTASRRELQGGRGRDPETTHLFALYCGVLVFTF